MADQNREPEGVQGEHPRKGKKKGLLLGGGTIGLIAAAYIVSMVALPVETKTPPFDGPFVTTLSQADIQVNLKGDGGRRYLVMSLQAKYLGYDELYLKQRVADPVYQADMIDALIGVSRQKSMEDVEDALGQESLKEEIREAVDPLLFPIHVGNALSFYKPHEESGIAAGRSIDHASMRGGFHAHVIKVDGLKDEISLDDGPVVDFDGSEADLLLENASGLTVYVDLTGMPEDWSGELNVGTFGTVKEIKFSKFITQ